MNRFFLILVLLPAMTISSQVRINWLPWSESTFTNAKTEAKLIFVDVGTEWCTACNLIEEKTYVDSGIIKNLNNNFICIKADDEAQPC